MTLEKAQSVLEVMEQQKETLQHANFGDFHHQLDKLQGLALEMEYILKDFMSPITLDKLGEFMEDAPDLVLAALEQRQCARSIVFRGLVFLGYTSELLQQDAYDWFEGHRLARNPREMYEFYSQIMFPQQGESTHNPMPRFTTDRPVAVRAAFLTHILQDARWVDNVIYNDKGKVDWRKGVRRGRNRDREAAGDSADERHGLVAAKHGPPSTIKNRVDRIDLRGGGMNSVMNPEGQKTPVYLDTNIFAELTYNFVELNVKKFLMQLLQDYEHIIKPTLRFDDEDINKWVAFLINVEKLLKVSQSMIEQAPEATDGEDWSIPFDVDLEMYGFKGMKAAMKTLISIKWEAEGLRKDAQEWQAETSDAFWKKIVKHVLLFQVPFDELVDDGLGAEAAMAASKEHREASAAVHKSAEKVLQVVDAGSDDSLPPLPVTDSNEEKTDETTAAAASRSGVLRQLEQVSALVQLSAPVVGTAPPTRGGIIIPAVAAAPLAPAERGPIRQNGARIPVEESKSREQFDGETMSLFMYWFEKNLFN